MSTSHDSHDSHGAPVAHVSQVPQSPVPPRLWRMSIVASVVLWVAMAAGNIALYAVHPAKHWPVLEALETLQTASLIPVALVIHQLNQRATLSLIITTIGIGAMVALVAIDVGFVTELVAFSKGPIGGPIFYVGWLTMLGWLLGASAVAWRRRSLPRSVAALGMATAATATLLYPVWAIRLLRALDGRTTPRQRPGKGVTGWQ